MTNRYTFHGSVEITSDAVRMLRTQGFIVTLEAGEDRKYRLTIENPQVGVNSTIPCARLEGCEWPACPLSCKYRPGSVS